MPAAFKRRINSPRRSALLDSRQLKAELRRVLDDHAKAVKKEFEGVVDDWQNKPRFVIEQKIEAEMLTVVVRPDKRMKASRVFGYVDRGTDGPYTIKPKKQGGRLAFQTGYQPKTLPIAQSGVGPGAAGGPLVFARQVTHPGIDARLFSETIQRRTDKDFRRNVENAFRRMARRANK
jgi:hypothetical protein